MFGRILMCCTLSLFECLNQALAQTSSSSDDPKTVVENYSNQMITILKGPIAKVLSFVVLLACVGALLRGRHKLAISCGVAFVVLLFLQVI